MKQFYLSFTCLLLVFSIQTHSQSVKLTGTVKDSLGKPLEMASLIAKVKESGKIESYAITNDAGRYQLFLPLNETFTLQASYLGFETNTFDVTVGDDRSDILKDIVIKAATDQLDGV